MVVAALAALALAYGLNEHVEYAARQLARRPRRLTTTALLLLHRYRTALAASPPQRTPATT